MNVIDLFDHLRIEVLRDSAKPYLFSDDALLRYLNEGYRLFARKTHYFTDEVEVVTTDGVARYDLPKGTVHVRQVEIDGRWLTPFTRRAKPRMMEGRPLSYSTDTAQRSLKLWPRPDQAYSVNIERAHLPADLTLSSEIDLPDDWALLLGEWVTYRALRNNDPDGSNTVAATHFWEQWQIGLRDAKRDITQLAMGDAPSAQPQQWT